MVEYLQIQGSAESRYHDQQLLFHLREAAKNFQRGGMRFFVWKIDENGGGELINSHPILGEGGDH